MQQVCCTRVGVRVMKELGGFRQHLRGRHPWLATVAALVRAGYLAQTAADAADAADADLLLHELQSPS